MLKDYIVNGKQYQFEEGKQPTGAVLLKSENPSDKAEEPAEKAEEPSDKAEEPAEKDIKPTNKAGKVKTK